MLSRKAQLTHHIIILPDTTCLLAIKCNYKHKTCLNCNKGRYPVVCSRSLASIFYTNFQELLYSACFFNGS